MLIIITLELPLNHRSRRSYLHGLVVHQLAGVLIDVGNFEYSMVSCHNQLMYGEAHKLSRWLDFRENMLPCIPKSMLLDLNHNSFFINHLLPRDIEFSVPTLSLLTFRPSDQKGVTHAQFREIIWHRTVRPIYWQYDHQLNTRTRCFDSFAPGYGHLRSLTYEKRRKLTRSL